MMKYLIGISVIFLTACGGGSVAPVQELEIATTPPVQTSTTIAKTKVIDGYVEGANVYIDFNYNFTQDDNEPSALYDAESYTYYFTTDQFNFTDFSVECALARPRVAEVPEGAYDIDRGYVESAYEMIYLPYGGNDRANVTPLTTLFLSYVDISTAPEPCGADADAIAYELQTRVTQVLDNITLEFGVDAYTFYDDFIATENESLAQYGQRIVDFISTTYTVSQLLEDTYGIVTTTQLDKQLVESIIANTPIDTLTFATFSKTESVVESDGYISSTLYAIYDLVADANGNLIDADGNPYEITVASLQEHGTFQERQQLWSQTPVFGNNLVMLELNNGVYIADIGDIRVTSVRQIRGDKVTLWLNNVSNPYFEFDWTNMFAVRDQYQFEDIYNDVMDLSNTMISLSNNNYLLYYGDHQILQQGQWAYREHHRKDGLRQVCDDLNTGAQYEGNEAYNVCSQHID